MLTSLVLTVIGRDRPGLVNALSDVVAAHGANWLESRMAYLAGQFAGIVHLQVAQPQSGTLIEALSRLESVGLKVAVTETRAAAAPADGRVVVLELIGQDKPGIVRDVSGALAHRGVSIEELESGCESAAWSGETMFKARARLRVPPAVRVDELRSVLESLAHDLMVDVEIDEPGEPI